MPKKILPLKKSAQDVQDKIFRKMSADKKLKLASDFSMFILKTSRTDGGKTNHFPKESCLF